jgi:CBS-domain-containing membrane protein
MEASDVMTRHVATVGRDTSVSDAIRLMLDRGISGLPVVDSDRKVVGILTEGDLLRRAEMHTEKQRPRWFELLLGSGRLSDEYVDTHGRKVGEIMTENVISITADTWLANIVRLMERHRIKQLPVLRSDALIGIVSRADLMRALAQLIAKEAGSASDGEIRKEVLAELANSVWAPRAGVTISVQDGVVELDGTIIGNVRFDGTIINEKEREALRIAAENAPGVRAVKDNLVWIEPVSGDIIPVQDDK